MAFANFFHPGELEWNWFLLATVQTDVHVYMCVHVCFRGDEAVSVSAVGCLNEAANFISCCQRQVWQVPRESALSGVTCLLDVKECNFLKELKPFQRISNTTGLSNTLNHRFECFPEVADTSCGRHYCHKWCCPCQLQYGGFQEGDSAVSCTSHMMAAEAAELLCFQLLGRK